MTCVRNIIAAALLIMFKLKSNYASALLIMPRQKYFCRGINVTFMTQMNRHKGDLLYLTSWYIDSI